MPRSTSLGAQALNSFKASSIVVAPSCKKRQPKTLADALEGMGRCGPSLCQAL